MVYKLIITDQINKTAGFTFEGGSISDVLAELEGYFGDAVQPEMVDGYYRAVLYHIQFENTGEDEDALLDNLTNPEYQNDIKSWFLSDISTFEHDLRDYLDQRSVFDHLLG